MILSLINISQELQFSMDILTIVTNDPQLLSTPYRLFETLTVDSIHSLQGK